MKTITIDKTQLDQDTQDAITRHATITKAVSSGKYDPELHQGTMKQQPNEWRRTGRNGYPMPCTEYYGKGLVKCACGIENLMHISADVRTDLSWPMNVEKNDGTSYKFPTHPINVNLYPVDVEALYEKSGRNDVTDEQTKETIGDPVKPDMSNADKIEAPEKTLKGGEVNEDDITGQEDRDPSKEEK